MRTRVRDEAERSRALAGAEAAETLRRRRAAKAAEAVASSHQVGWRDKERILYDRYVGAGSSGDVGETGGRSRDSGHGTPDSEHALLRLVSYCETNLGKTHPRAADALSR